MEGLDELVDLTEGGLSDRHLLGELLFNHPFNLELVVILPLVSEAKLVQYPMQLSYHLLTS